MFDADPVLQIFHERCYLGYMSVSWSRRGLVRRPREPLAASETRRSHRRAVSFLAAVLLIAPGCGSSSQPPAPAPWVQLERYADAGSENAFSIKSDGSFEGNADTTFLEGQLSTEELDELRNLVAEPLLPIYRADSLPVDESTGFDQWGYPVFRIVVREPGHMNSDESVLDAFFVEGELDVDTQRLVTFVNVIVDRYGVPER